jgi:hypothetical protein
VYLVLAGVFGAIGFVAIYLGCQVCRVV